MSAAGETVDPRGLFSTLAQSAGYLSAEDRERLRQEQTNLFVLAAHPNVDTGYGQQTVLVVAEGSPDGAVHLLALTRNTVREAQAVEFAAQLEHARAIGPLRLELGVTRPGRNVWQLIATS